MKTQLGAKNILFPVPPALIVSGSVTKSNIVTIAWISMLSGKPPLLGISMGPQKHSIDIIRTHGDFSVNIPSADHYIETDYCGITSGKDVDKFSDTKFTRIPSNHIQAPLIKECPFNIECKLYDEKTIGRTVLLIGEIMETHIDVDKLSPDKKIDIRKVNPLIYCTNVREYWSFGEKIADAYAVGNQLKI